MGDTCDNVLILGDRVPGTMTPELAAKLAPAPIQADCPHCGAGTANVQGLTACPECGWTTN